MNCPFCQAEDTKVMDSRLVNEVNQVRRRRICSTCNERFTTYETVELIMPRIIKRDQSRVSFEEDRLRNGMLRALEKRPVSTAAVDASVMAIIHKMRASGEKEITSDQIGEWVMDELRKLDDVAYVRFASVYRRFQDLESFKAEIEKMLRATESH
ncbi:MAG: transcriptional regulator NrdR [Gammaproteobacteria bacterium]|nr:transcriptional regulator NrdR [Gammaproteobacteria bacterium]